MKNNTCLKKVVSFFITFIILFTSSATAVSAAKFSYSPSSGTISGSTQIRVILDPQSATIDSATAVVTFDSNRVEIESIAAGSFFDNISTDTSQSGEVAIIGYMNAGNIGKSISDTMATITLKPKVTSGTIALGYSCSAADPDDSNIMNSDNVNLLATDEQCSGNVTGSYTVGSSTNPTPTTSSSSTSNDSSTTTTDSTTTDTTTKGDQPVLPEQLPQSGPENWLKWIVSGLAFIGIGLLLL